MNCKVICGTGIRHLETAAALSMSPTYFSPCVGCPDIILSGKKVLLTNGSLVDERDYSCFVDDPDLCRSMIQPLANSGQSSIIITDPYIVRALGGDKPIPGEIFRYVYNATPRTCRI
ncbi:MAG: hypothetical protein Q8N61_01590 [bacterium]|nr:hypothetical protein [bacterium]